MIKWSVLHDFCFALAVFELKMRVIQCFSVIFYICNENINLFI